MLPMRNTGTPAQSAVVFAEEPYLANSLTCSTVVQHHPCGSSGNPLVSGAAGSTYFSRQPFGGALLAAANLESWSSSHFRRRSARMRSSNFDAGSVLGCL